MQKLYLRSLGLLFLLCTLSATAWAQVSVTGTVTDDAGLGLPGVNVVVVGTSSGTITDLDGNYTLSAPADGTLRFSYTGFGSQEVLIDGRNRIDVTLSTDAGLLDEIVVVGYGSQGRESVTGAISAVDSEALTEVTTPNLGEAIQGRLAGVQVIANGAPGDAPQIQVRGIGSINFGSGPLIVVDGVPGAGGLNQFDSRDVESITVLKDASSTAIYGSRASNGVLLVTTKMGSRNQPIRISAETTLGVQTQPERYEGFSTADYVDYAEVLSGIPLARPLDEVPPGETVPYRQQQVDYQDALFQDGLLTQNSLHVSGGSDRSSFFSSFGYLRQEGVIIGGGYERFNFRINSRHDLVESGRFRFTQTLSIANDERNGLENNLLRDAVQSIPYLPIRNPNNIGGFNGAQQGLDSADPRNPIRNALQEINRTRTTRLFGTAALEYDIIGGLTGRVLISANNQIFRTYNQDPIYQATVSNDINVITEQRSNDYSPLYSGQLTYDRIIGNHSINATAVGEIQESYNGFMSVQGNHTTNGLVNLEGATITAGTTTRRKTVLQSALGRFTYGYKGRYLISGSVRRDGSSIFAPGNGTEIFPAGAVAWRISEEPFMRDTRVSTLKLRVSYGRTGSIGLNPYNFQAPIQQTIGAVLGGDGVPVLGAYINDLANTQLSWEITDMLNVGLDVGFLNNRLNFSMEYYDREVDNLILDIPLSPSFGPDGTSVNIGAMRNTGVEFQGQFFSPRSQTFVWNVSANLSTNTNEVLRLAVEDGAIFFGRDEVGQGYTGEFDPTITRVGDPVFSFYGFETDGLYQSVDEINAANALDDDPSTSFQDNASPGDVRFVDQNGDGRITEQDRVILGSYLPDFTYGLNFTGSLRNFDLSLFLQGSQGNDIYNGFRSLRYQTTRLFNGAPEKFLDAWTPQNTSTDVPRVALTDPNNNRRMSDRFLEDGSYLRLKNITLGYRMPFGGDSPIANLRVYISAQNAITLTGYSGLDPEIGQITGGLVGFDAGRYPVARSFLCGLQLGF
ncbi:TonB-dependent receptor P3 [Neolewinella maritima]|uniref:TonB-dependent receptor P3 n=1 Tax=Neolewinella maritima TaxID=1383882 RepID=A0ABN8F7D8_9BACT|nr:TonB-dependent receptor [Neolewinella maritima]CAH1002505.1 TonB-dependent receptor P3 [Neolewinella maritima]